MNRSRLQPALCFGVALLVLNGCAEDGANAPPDRPEVPVQELKASDDAGNLAPLDLVYVCGNKFLATNSTRRSVHLTYRVVGSSETGGITLPPGPVEDPGHSETELETKKAGIVELYQDGQRLVRRRNLKLLCGAPAVARLASATAAEVGTWTNPFPWPVVSIHLSLLPTGKVLAWGLIGSPQIWDPETGQFTEVPSQAELFCSGHSLLADGRVLVTGGHIASDRGIPDISIFDPSTGAWTQSTPMRRGRWYPTNTTLANGSVVILAGRDEVGDEVAEPEVWSPNGIRQLDGASLVLPYYPRTFVAPNGQVFYAGEQQTTRYLSTSGSGNWTTVGQRRYGARPYGAAVMYEAGKILYVGGGRTTNTAETIDLNVGSPTWQWTGSMANARRNLNATMLPTGEVLVTGGSSAPAFNDVTQAIFAAEVWNPATGVWTTLASNSVRRTYHSTTLLLPDGRVLHTGSGEGADQPEEFNAELFSPPYLSKGPRPAITGAPTQVGYGTEFQVQTPDPTGIAKVSLIRLGSVTHAFDMNARFQWLTFVRQSGSLRITAPPSGTRAPPGHYLLFLVNQTGVPSVGKIVKVGPTSDPTPSPNSAPAPAFLAGCAGLNCTFADRSTDPDGNLSGWQWNFGDGQSSSARDPNHAYQSGGTYTVTLTARDREDASAASARQVTVPGPQFALGLTLTTRTEGGKQISTLNWTRAQGQSVYIYRNGLVLLSTPNDGRQSISKNGTAPSTFIFKVCEAGSTICSNPATATFAGGDPPDNAPPNAAFTPGCTVTNCRFSDGSNDTDGTVTSWQWNFGDGSSSSQRNPAHNYGTGGDYDVRLTVTDNLGAQGTTTKRITVGNPPNQTPSANFTASCTGLDCDFTDGSSDADGFVDGWAWDFGDGGTSNDQNSSHSYATDGIYTVTLTVTDDDGVEGVTSQQVTAGTPPNQGPTANFTFDCTVLACAFTDGSSDPDGSVNEWAWDFGDGSTDNARNPSHTYAGDGTYTVTLTVRDEDGEPATTSKQVPVTTPPPNVNPTADFSSSCTGLTCSFTDESTDSDGTVTAWAWSFGDGAVSGVRNPNRTYGAAGTYTVDLTVTDNAGGTNQHSAQVTVSAPTSSITLTVSGWTDATKHYIQHLWSGATGTSVDFYRNGKRINSTPNDGRHTTVHSFDGTATWRVKICQLGSTTNCSPERSITLSN
jgi:PKD repeat protein